MKYICGKPE